MQVGAGGELVEAIGGSVGEDGVAQEERLALSALVGEAGKDLAALVSDSEREMEALAREFRHLGLQADTIVQLAEAVVSCVEDEKMFSIQSDVQALGAMTRSFVRERMKEAERIAQLMGAEASLLGRLSTLTRSQKAIVRETEMLRVLTNIEVSRLGKLGEGFQYLALELDGFSEAVSRSTSELMSHTEQHRREIEKTRRELVREMPRVREEFARVEASLETAEKAIHEAVSHLREVPVEFRNCARGIAGEIAGVVAAIQAHDITRQQMEHASANLEWLAGKLRAGDTASAGPETPQIWAGLRVQIYQLRNCVQTVGNWTAQIRKCLAGIDCLTSSGILGLGAAVLAQERDLAAQVEHVERLEQQCRAGDEEVQASSRGITALMQLVHEHLETSKSVRERLQLLTFNSIVEASHLGTQANGILEISRNIRRIGAEWGENTGRSEQTMREILDLVEQSSSAIESFLRAGDVDLRAAQEQTREAMATLRTASECAGSRGGEIATTTKALQNRIAQIGMRDCFAASADRLEQTLGKIGAAQRQMERDSGKPAMPLDVAELERVFSANYTTEMERAVLRAALNGEDVPMPQQNFSGNDVELF